MQTFLLKKVTEVNQKIFNSPDLNDSFAAELAIKDCALLLAYLY